MGSKGSKDASGKNSKVPAKAATKLSDKDIKFLSEKTGMSKDDINNIFAKFNQNNPDGKLDKAEFMKMYTALRNEPVSNLDEITNMIFRGELIQRINSLYKLLFFSIKQLLMMITMAF